MREQIRQVVAHLCPAADGDHCLRCFAEEVDHCEACGDGRDDTAEDGRDDDFDERLFKVVIVTEKTSTRQACVTAIRVVHERGVGNGAIEQRVPANGQLSGHRCLRSHHRQQQYTRRGRSVM